ncbi:MAG TPA: sugar phosphate isomerase/epimerase [Fimbriimonadaceae bacterium]|nr:sugar phosphate isomerase/epimerase [Fimbriimonadaceae bacterium]HRJ97024.1 sugar phosphate isomerase/epimerase [Fimbriimonadaceae bacterium]
MKIGIFTALFGDKGLAETLDLVKAEGIEAVEFGAGAYPGSAHLDVPRLLESKQARDKLLREVSSRGLTISAISVHGNPLHPVKSIAQDHHEAFVNAVKLAALLGVGCVNGFSGCPGDGPNAKNPNWVTCAWPDEFRDILDWQWSRRVIPYWRKQADLLAEHRVRFCIEMHPGFVCYSNDTLLRLRNGVGKKGEWIGANFDPSHLWWQGIDPIAAVRELGHEGALFHVHAKDTRIDPYNSARNGNLDTKSYGDILARSWVFRSVGYGHSVEWWKDFVSNLRMVGYDDVLSIEHEDGLMSPMEGLRKALQVLKAAVIAEPAGPMFWAKE